MSCSTLVVLVLIVGYIFYLVRLVWICLGQLGERPGRQLGAGLSLTYVLPDDDDKDHRDYDLVWHTQLPALELLRSAGRGGVPIAQMTDLYQQFARAYPELCDGSNFSDWLDALQNADVVARKGDVIAITKKGLLMLEAWAYVTHAGGTR